MPEIKPRKHNRLNKRQIELLYALYRFRFGTTDLLAELIGKKSGVLLYSRLQLLVEQKYVGRNFDSSYRIRGEHATYYLLPKAFKALAAYQAAQEEKGIKIDLRVFKRIYKDKEASEQFISHCLAVLEIHNRLKKHYGNKLQFFTKSDLTLESYHYFPKSLPDGFLSYREGDIYKRSFLDVFERGTPFFLMAKRIKHHIDYFENGEWGMTKFDFPTIIMVCETAAEQKKLERRIAKSLENAGVDDMDFRVLINAVLIEDFGEILTG